MSMLLSPNTQAILLLTAPLITGRAGPPAKLLSPGEYKRLARLLREMKREPADLLTDDGGALVQSCRVIVEETRMKRLLGRGFLLTQAVERWQSRAINVMSRADHEYPRRLKTRLREDAPAILYACGNIQLLESGGLAVVGSRDADETLVEYAVDIGERAARAFITVVSGGAKGIDRAAMRGVLEAGGNAIGVLSDSLEKAAMNRENRNMLIDDRLVLVSPFDPNAGFNVGNAMRRNKLIYALADASLVVSSDLDKGGTWSGAVEQLENLRYVPIYVRSSGALSRGLTALQKKGARPWPNPHDTPAFRALLDQARSTFSSTTTGALSLFEEESSARFNHVLPGRRQATVDSISAKESSLTQPIREKPLNFTVGEPSASLSRRDANQDLAQFHAQVLPSDAVFEAVHKAIRQILAIPMKETDVALALGVTTPQAKKWLHRMVAEGTVERLNKPVRYKLRH